MTSTLIFALLAEHSHSAEQYAVEGAILLSLVSLITWIIKRIMKDSKNRESELLKSLRSVHTKMEEAFKDDVKVREETNKRTVEMVFHLREMRKDIGSLTAEVRRSNGG